MFSSKNAREFLSNALSGPFSPVSPCLQQPTTAPRGSTQRKSLAFHMGMVQRPEGSACTPGAVVVPRLYETYAAPK